jgi:hypothetical protein
MKTYDRDKIMMKNHHKIETSHPAEPPITNSKEKP